MQRYDRPHTLFYLDPPYWETEGYGVPFAWTQYEQIAERMSTCSGKVVLSINDHPDIRACFRRFQSEELEIDYTVGGAHQRAARRELVIYSWDREADPAGLF